MASPLLSQARPILPDSRWLSRIRFERLASSFNYQRDAFFPLSVARHRATEATARTHQRPNRRPPSVIAPAGSASDDPAPSRTNQSLAITIAHALGVDNSYVARYPRRFPEQGCQRVQGIPRLRLQERPGSQMSCWTLRVAALSHGLVSVFPARRELARVGEVGCFRSRTGGSQRCTRTTKGKAPPPSALGGVCPAPDGTGLLPPPGRPPEERISCVPWAGECPVESRVRENRTHGSERGRWRHDLRDFGGSGAPVRQRPTLPAWCAAGERGGAAAV